MLPAEQLAGVGAGSRVRRLGKSGWTSTIRTESRTEYVSVSLIMRRSLERIFSSFFFAKENNGYRTALINRFWGATCTALLRYVVEEI